jgi:hypothetical protein
MRKHEEERRLKVAHVKNRGLMSMSTDKHEPTLEMIETPSTLLAEAAHLITQLPIELFPDVIEQRLAERLTPLLLALNERGVALTVEKDSITIQNEVRAVRDTINDVITLIKEQGDQEKLLAPNRRDELIRVVMEQSEVFPLVNRGSIHRTQIALWVARQLAKKKNS